MANLFSPQFSGRIHVKSSAPAFFAKMKARVDSGLLMGRPHPRSRYAVTSHTQRELAFRAADLKTAINVGLNDAVLRVASAAAIARLSRSMRGRGMPAGPRTPNHCTAS